jgi:3,4-dihydroxy 2-butanone 4-phosphate synthase/GTP cyclohydrolase II
MAPTLDIDPQLLQRVNQAIEAIRAGKMVVLVDDEDRENEGDLCMAADLVTPEAINFMATHGRGLICLTLTEAQVERLGLPMMTTPGRGGPPLGTAFTVSIEAKAGVTTGISAADRSHTTRIAADPSCHPDDLVTPGHVFPLKARDGGVLVRTGQTEGSVDLARLAGRTPAGVICEIMNDDGSMARMPDLEKFGQRHDLLIVTIADLIQYRLQTERLVKRAAERVVTLDATGTEWHAVAFEVGPASSFARGETPIDPHAPHGGLGRRELLALIRGDVTGDSPVLCRMHAGSMLDDLFAEAGKGRTLRDSILRIEQEGRGIIVYFPPREGLLRDFVSQDGTPLVSKPDPLREYGLGAQVLADLGVHKIRLLTTNPRKVVGLQGFGLEIVESVQVGSARGDRSTNDVREAAK